jgi:hypothetical protein
MMIRRLTVTLTLTLALTIPLIGSASAQEMHLDLPPGIAKQAQPLMMEMMAHMDDMDMSEEEMQVMMAEMQMIAGQLPPGIFLQLLEVMVEFDDMESMMALHSALHEGDLLDQPPGQILRYARSLAA